MRTEHSLAHPLVTADVQRQAQDNLDHYVLLGF
jgi:hypothetical protein